MSFNFCFLVYGGEIQRFFWWLPLLRWNTKSKGKSCEILYVSCESFTIDFFLSCVNVLSKITVKIIVRSPQSKRSYSNSFELFGWPSFDYKQRKNQGNKFIIDIIKLR